MNRLQICIEALRVLAKQPETQVNRVRVVEMRINEYLGTDPAKWRSLIEPLRYAINTDAEMRPSESSFWTIAQAYIDVCLSRLPDD